MSLPFSNTVGSKIEQDGSTTGANLAGVLDENGSKIDGVVEQNCEAGAVKHGPKFGRFGLVAGLPLPR